MNDDCHRSSGEDNGGRRRSSSSRRRRSYSDSGRRLIACTRMRLPRREAPSHYSVNNDFTNDRRRSLRRSRSSSACRDDYQSRLAMNDY